MINTCIMGVLWQKAYSGVKRDTSPVKFSNQTTMFRSYLLALRIWPVCHVLFGAFYSLKVDYAALGSTFSKSGLPWLLMMLKCSSLRVFQYSHPLSPRQVQNRVIRRGRDSSCALGYIAHTKKEMLMYLWFSFSFPRWS